MIATRVPDSLCAMVKAEAAFAEKTVSELIKEILAEHYNYKEQEEVNYEE